MRNFTGVLPILDGATADGAGTAQLVEDFTHLEISLDTTDSASGVVKIQASMQEALPDFNAAQSPTNQWTYVQIKDLEDETGVNGNDGVTLSGSDDHRMFEVNVNGVRWINAIISAYSAGTFYVRGKAYSI